MKFIRAIVNTMIILILLFASVNTFAAVIRVPAEQPTIQAGINTAIDGDTVLVADGVYKGIGNVNIDFKGKQITLKSQNGPEVTIIDCERKENTRGFKFNSRETNNSVLDGFTITNGLHLNGAGIYCNNSSPTIRNCVITENSAGDFFDSSGTGGGIYCIDSNLYLSSCIIKGNRAGSDIGGGVYLYGDSKSKVNPVQSIIYNCTITENFGTGIYNTDHANIWLKMSTVSNNRDGGGVVVTGNMNQGINRISNCLIELNNGEKGAGVSCTENTNLIITDSVIKTNFGILGGGIFCHRTSTIDVSQCLIVENFAPQGAGILVESETGKATITNCTIANNNAIHKGGGIFVFANSDTLFTLSNSIVWGNQSLRSHPEIALSAQRVVIKSCNIGGGLEGLDLPFKPDEDKFIYENNIDVDPLFVNIYKHDYSLKPNSPSKQMGFQSSVEEVLSVNAVGKKLVLWGELRSKKF